ncbi:MAG TPA: hypothetical protein VM759_00995 [Longimicrobium sp.]|nr:hypothetical protein [Longimicrobium sp.]
MTLPYTVEVVGPIDAIDPENDNVDVYVRFEDGRSFSAAFFTPANIARLLDRYRVTGECSRGLYFWSVNMIVITTLTEDGIRETVADLLATGEFNSAFAQDEPKHWF